MKLKVCGMREPENIRQLEEEIRPDWMGLIFYSKSPRFVEDSAAEAISDVTLPKVGVFVNESISFILDKIDKFGLAAVQLHGSESPEFVRELKLKTDKKLWKVVSVADQIDWEQLREYVGLVEYFLFDTATKGHGGSGRQFDWKVLESYPFEVPFILSGGVDEDSAEELIRFAEKEPQLIGIDLNSKFEDAPGLKNIEKLKRFRTRLQK